jgi:hypothetical protein
LESTLQQPTDVPDDPVFTVHWIFERADLEDAFKAWPVFRRYRRWRRWLVALAVLVCVSIASRPTWSDVGVLALVLLAVLVLETTPRLMAWLGWRADPRLHGGEMEATVSAAGVRVEGPGAVSECAWEMFQQVYETDRAFLLSVTKALSSAIVLPKRAVTGQADIAGLRILLHRMVRGSSIPGKTSRGTPSGRDR